jgi:asparagine synthetase B (glutamine-hydrolysing)
VRVDERALGSWLIRSGDPSGLALLEEAFRKGSESAGVALALHHKRQREWDRAADVWAQLLEASRSLLAAVELAKHHEHRTRRYQTALQLVETALAWNLPLDMRSRREVTKRRERLERKLRAAVERSKEKTV